MRNIARRGKLALIVGICTVALILIGSGGRALGLQSSAHTATSSSMVGLPGYDIDVFAQGTTSYFNPDSVEVAGKYVYIGYQNITAKDGSDGKSSTVVQYTLQGKVVQTFSVLDHCDGLRFDPYTNLPWAT